MKKLFLFSIFFMVVFISCKKDNTNPDVKVTPPKVTPAMARDSLFYIMKEFYYWYDKPEAASITESSKENYKDPYELLEAMRYKTLDRWSFVAEYNAFLGELEGDFVGHGIRTMLAQDGSARIASIYDKSPLYANGVRRGWKIKKINNTDPVPALLNGTFADLLGPSQAGITNIFVFQKPDGTEVTISSTKTAFKVNTVLICDTLQLLTGTTGHLVFDSFINPSSDEFKKAFAGFMGAGIKDLILDLRYNTGGLLSVAQILASYIAGNAAVGKIFAKLQYNDKNQDQNFTFPFLTTPNSLSLPRIVVITTRSTSSASEAVINGLKPFVNVITIGDTTDGKPTGMNIWPIADKYIMVPITFKLVNANNEGEYYAGFPPAKEVPDDITHDFTDREELCMKEAIYYLENGSVSTKGIQQFKRYPVYSERSKWLDNVFVYKN